MEKILEGMLMSDKSEGFKKKMCKKVEDLGYKPQPTDNVHRMLQTTIRLSMDSEDFRTQQACKSIYLIWGHHNRNVLEAFFTPILLQTLLDARPKSHNNSIWFMHQTMLAIRSNKPQFQNLCKIVQHEAQNYIKVNRMCGTVVSFCNFLLDCRDCLPSAGKRASFCNDLIATTSTFEAPRTPGSMKQYIKDISGGIRGLLTVIWQEDQTIIVKCLEQIFAIISHAHKELPPSLALAGIVPNIPIAYVDTIVKQTVSDRRIADENIKMALSRMIDWLAWPGAQNIHTWIISFFNGLASVHKYTILMEVTETKIESVYEKLHFMIVRKNAFPVLSHMLLSYQHSPDPFHKIVQKVPNTVQRLLEEQSESSYSVLCQMSVLLHTLMSQHLGFPDLYEPVLNALKTLPKPSSDEMKDKLSSCNWKTQDRPGATVSRSYILSKRSETGKTGLVNLGNTCYMNSVLQALFMCDSFCQKVLRAPVSTQQPILFKLQRVFAFLSASQRAAIAPSEFLSASRPPWFTAGTQQDCSEFIRYLYDQLHEQDLKRQKVNAMKSIQQNASSSEVVDNSLNDAKELNSTLIGETFMGRLVTTLKCLSCGTESEHSESFTDLPLAFPESLIEKASGSVHGTKNHKASLVGGASPSKTSGVILNPHKSNDKVIALEELLSHYLDPEKLEGDNKYHCDVCNGLRDGERIIHITSPPEYLNLTLLRFAYNVKAKARSKIFKEVVYPKIIYVPIRDSRSKMVVSSNGTIKKSKSESAKCSGHYEAYGLTAVIVHSGYSSDSGHYYCYARHGVPAESANQKTTNGTVNEIDDFFENQWFLFNDSRVTFSRYESFCNVTKTFGKDTAYVLFYKRVASNGRPIDSSNLVPSIADPPLRKDLRSAIDKDNRLFLQELELQERSRSLEASQSQTSSFYNWKDHDDNGPPGSCGGGGQGGLSTNRLVF